MTTQAIKIPDLGGVADVDVIEICVAVGDTISEEQSLVSLESDKATMDVPSPLAGKVEKIHVKMGDKVSEGTLLIDISTSADVDASPAVEADQVKAESEKPVSESVSEEAVAVAPEPVAPVPVADVTSGDVYAGPAVRRLAREIGINLSAVPATGERGRITKSDVKRYVQSGMSGQAGSAGLNIAAMPEVDFSRFGSVRHQPLSKIQKFSGANLHRNWVSIPHVTQFAETDITELEAFRQREKSALQKQGVRLTPLVFMMKAVVSALRAFPHFNASLSADGAYVVIKEYYHIGVAVDTPNGLVVPVIRDVDKKGLVEIAKELAAISEKARTKGLLPAEMQGGCFTISSLGGIGGTAFTPIINAPEVAILGVSRSQTKPVWQDGAWQPRLMLPLSLSYDHRVIDGADGARFITHLSACLADLRQLLL